MEEVMDILFATHKGKYLDMSKDNIYIKKTDKGVQINDKITITKSKILHVIVKHDSQLMARYQLQAFTSEKLSVRCKPQCEQDISGLSDLRPCHHNTSPNVCKHRATTSHNTIESNHNIS
jgi:hypothetical protein